MDNRNNRNKKNNRMDAAGTGSSTVWQPDNTGTTFSSIRQKNRMDAGSIVKSDSELSPQDKLEMMMGKEFNTKEDSEEYIGDEPLKDEP